jgi:hypothetical protein
MYGLNHRRSFLRLPECKDCGDGMKLSLCTPDEVTEFATDVLKDADCDCCALFFVMKDGTYKSYFKTLFDSEEIDDEGLELTFALASAASTDRHAFADLDGELRFCCYSLILEIEDGLFEVCI